MMGVSKAPQYTSLSNLSEDLMKVVDAYRDQVLAAIGDGVQEGAEIYVKEVKKISPPDDGPGIGGHYRDSWTIKKMRRAKFVKYIGNTKKVKAHYADSQPTIPLINILEFSSDPNKHRPHVGKAISNSRDQIFNLIASKIQKGGNNA